MAMSKIQELHRQQPSTKNQLTYVDFGAHVRARSIDDARILSGDRNPYHYGLEPRLVVLQLLSSVLAKRREAQIGTDSNHRFQAVGAVEPLTVPVDAIRTVSLMALAVIVLFRSIRLKKLIYSHK